MTKPAINISASVHQRLLNKAKETSRPFQEFFSFYALERFLVRLGKTRYANDFILKGALLIRCWSPDSIRPTMDIDLLGKTDNSPDNIRRIMAEASDITIDDGLVFLQDKVTSGLIQTQNTYSGIRAKVYGNLGPSRISIHIDVGFGDIIIPKPDIIEYPAILDFPTVTIQTYTLESLIAEKFHPMVKLDILNSRMKDYYDIYLLSQTMHIQGNTLSRAIKETFSNRTTALPNDLSKFLNNHALEAGKQELWEGFLKKSMITGAPNMFAAIIASVTMLLSPVVEALNSGTPFNHKWSPKGPWIL